MYTRLFMGDVPYWRTKKNGKWTWRKAVIVAGVYHPTHDDKLAIYKLMEEEE